MTDPSAKPTILLAADEPAVRDLVEFALELNGYSVLPASDGKEAVELSRQYPGTRRPQRGPPGPKGGPPHQVAWIHPSRRRSSAKWRDLPGA